MEMGSQIFDKTLWRILYNLRIYLNRLGLTVEIMWKEGTEQWFAKFFIYKKNED